MVELTRFPRFPLGHFPTPLEPLDRLTAYLRERSDRVPNLWIKRDDCTGLATGGNKTRKLEFLLGDALRLRSNTLITLGATQSNHARQTAAAAARAGLDCKILLERRQQRDDDYEWSGNVLLDDLLGAEIVQRYPSGTDLLAQARSLAERLEADGHRPYVIVGGGSSPVGALGYVACAQELEAATPAIDCVVHATGSCGTQAGLLAGLNALSSSTSVLGVSVRQSSAEQEAAVAELTGQTVELLTDVTPVDRGQIEVDDRWVGGGYGVPTDDMVKALRLVASIEGILLDPVYSGKAFAGLLGNIAEGRWAPSENVVFLHTGGTPGLFAYRTTLTQQ
jgi:L-cysteate sulfo-lyase